MKLGNRLETTPSSTLSSRQVDLPIAEGSQKETSFHGPNVQLS